MSKVRGGWSVVLFIAVSFTAFNAFAENADEALSLLKEGNKRFIAMKMQYPDISAERRTDTAVGGQKPFSIVLTCSDSRVPVEIIFDRGIGDIFVVRVAGNIATDPSVIGSIEYAAEHLDSPLLVIMGHTECGAVKAAISGPPLEGNVRIIQNTIKAVAERIEKDRPGLQGNDLTLAVVKGNVLQAKNNLLSESKEIEHMAGEGDLKIMTAVYDLKTGLVDWINDEI